MSFFKIVCALGKYTDIVPIGESYPPRNKPYFLNDPVRDTVMLDAIFLPEGFSDWGVWQAMLKEVGRTMQSYLCPCGQPLGWEGELHHGLVTRADVQGLDKDLAARCIHCSVNVVLVHRRCHDRLVRAQCRDALYRIYGEEAVRGWYSRTAKSVLLSKLDGFK